MHLCVFLICDLIFRLTVRLAKSAWRMLRSKVVSLSQERNSWFRDRAHMLERIRTLESQVWLSLRDPIDIRDVLHNTFLVVFSISALPLFVCLDIFFPPGSFCASAFRIHAQGEFWQSCMEFLYSVNHMSVLNRTSCVAWKCWNLRCAKNARKSSKQWGSTMR